MPQLPFHLPLELHLPPLLRARLPACQSRLVSSMACDMPALGLGSLRPLGHWLADGLGQEPADGQLADLVEA